MARKKTGATGNTSSGSTMKKVVSGARTGKRPAKKNRNVIKPGGISEDISNSGKSDNNFDKSVLKLENILSISDINELRKTLCGLLDNNGDIEIDASDVQSVDTAILQLLTAFCLKLDKNGHNIKWKNPTQTFIDRCCLLNLEESLKLY